MPAYTVPELSEMALAQIPAAVRGMARRKLARREKKLELTACLCSEFEFFEQQFNLAMAADSSADMLSVAVGIDPENLQAILDAIIKFLTDIAPLIKLFIDLLTVFLIVLALSAPASAQAVWGNRTYTSRVCSNPRCAMCASIQQQLSAQRVMQSVPVSSQSTEMEAYTVQVRVCQNGVCSYRNETRYRPRVAARAARLEARAENLQRRVAYTVSVPVVTRVKRCNGRQCWYENVTTYRTETRYRMEPAEPQAMIGPQRATPNSVARIQAQTNAVIKEAAQAPTPFDAVAAMIRLIQPAAGDVVYDLGSGDGRVLVAATVGGAKAVGIEIDPDKVADSRTMATVFGVQDKIKVYEGDILDYDLGQCMLVTMYLYPELMEAVAEKLPNGCKVWSYMHGLPGATKHEVDGYEFYEWTKA
jgi:hypothetical protein